MTGTLLKKSLQRIGISPQPKKCKCNDHAAIMDKRGPDWCQQNETTILEWMHTEADRMHLPFSQTVARMLLRRAINKAKKQKET